MKDLSDKPLSSVTPPRISVIIPTYNSARFIRQAVDSALDQTFTSLEVIVVDDGSTDDTRAVLQGYDNRVRYVYQDNTGPPGARNHGTRLAQGKFLVFLDADDYLLPYKLEEQMSCFETQPSLGVIHSGWRIVSQQGEKIADVEPWHEAPRLDLETWLMQKPVFMGSMLFRRVWWELAGGFNTRLHQTDDVELMLRLALMGCQMNWLCKSTICRRQHDSNITLNATQQADNLEAAMDSFFALPSMPVWVRQMENKVRYYTLMWIVWYLYLADCKDEIPRYLRRSLDYTIYTPTQTLFDWVGQFAKRLTIENRDINELRSILPYFKAAVQSEKIRIQAKEMLDTEKILNWLGNVWWHYLIRDETRAAEGLAAYHGTKPCEIVKLAQSSLLVTPGPDTVKLVTEFWGDVREQQIITKPAHYEAALYLTVFGQAASGHQWRTAGHALTKAVRASFHPTAPVAWFRFFGKALSYVLGGSSKGG